jgi:hypothetical protein
MFRAQQASRVHGSEHVICCDVISARYDAVVGKLCNCRSVERDCGVNAKLAKDRLRPCRLHCLNRHIYQAGCAEAYL